MSPCRLAESHADYFYRRFFRVFRGIVANRSPEEIQKKPHSFWSISGGSHFDHIVLWKSSDKIIYR